MSRKKRKIKLIPIVIAVLIAVAIYNWEAIQDFLGSEGGKGSLLPTPGTANNSQQSAATRKDRDEILAAVPETLRDNFFLTYKETGCCKSLTGKVAISVIMISDSVGQWDNDSVATLKTTLDGYAKDLIAEARLFDTELEIMLQYYNSQMTGDVCSGDYSYDWQDPALKSAGLPELKQMHTHITEKFQVKEAPVLFAFNKKGRAYATVGNDEFLVLFNDSDFDSFQHELSHIFGAKDFYYPQDVKKTAAEYFTDSVMNSGKSADPLTAYLIGWTDTLSESALGFLKDTNSITAEEMEAHRKNESMTGYGTKVFSYGTYTGDMIRGRCHGTGTMYYNNGGWYAGQWDNGSWAGEGSGKYIFDDGSCYEGSYKNGERHGTGVYTYASGSCYTGNWVNGERNGIGTMHYANGGWYTGLWTDGEWSGNGTGKYIFDDGSSYEGDYRDGKRHGIGTYLYADGSSYTGSWENGEKNGTGTMHYANGGWYTGTWQNGSRTGNGTGKEIYSNGTYEGEFLNGKRHGQGTYIWSSGDQFTGAWENGTRNGYGTYVWANGTSKSGIWRDGEFVN